MDKIKILEKPTTVDWDYDEDADVLYLSLGKPQHALGIDIGEGVVLRYDATSQEVVGITLIGLRARLLQNLSHAGQPEAA
ncbi:DUF2283 domain-containing protein [candidate division KSB1 bacterium]|nr:DUF2283 domain-containing protein [candidate division KSB1 bacterium]